MGMPTYTDLEGVSRFSSGQASGPLRRRRLDCPRPCSRETPPPQWRTRVTGSPRMGWGRNKVDGRFIRGPIAPYFRVMPLTPASIRRTPNIATVLENFGGASRRRERPIALSWCFNEEEANIRPTPDGSEPRLGTRQVLG